MTLLWSTSSNNVANSKFNGLSTQKRHNFGVKHTIILNTEEPHLSIPIAVNMIQVNMDWEELGKALGLSNLDIESIKAYDQKEHRQRLIETWHSRAIDQEFCQEKLKRAMLEASDRRESMDSESSVPSTPISPTGIIYDIFMLNKNLDELKLHINVYYYF